MSSRTHRSVIIVPAFNEEFRFPMMEYRAFLKQEISHNIDMLFVNDGSTDGTLSKIKELKSEFSAVDYISLSTNQGKAEAIRQAIMQIDSDKYRFIGYWDADLASPLNEIPHLLSYAEPKVRLIMGSRVKLLGYSEIHRSRKRHYLGRVFATFASKALGIPVYDTQCGAKLIMAEICKELFNEPFISQWLFDIELIFRLKKAFSDQEIHKLVVEVPLRNWKDLGNSKVKLGDYIKAPAELLRIYLKYK